MREQNCSQTLYRKILNTLSLTTSNLYLQRGNVKPAPQFPRLNRHFEINAVGNRIRKINAIKKILSKQRENGYWWSIMARCEMNRGQCQLFRPKMM